MTEESCNPPSVEEVKIVKVGNTCYVSVPREWLEEKGLTSGDTIHRIANGNLYYTKDKETVDAAKEELREAFKLAHDMVSKRMGKIVNEGGA